MSASTLGPDAAALAVRFLGGLQVRREGQLLPHPFRTPRTAALFAFLLLHPDREFGRRDLTEIFQAPSGEGAPLRSLASLLVPIRRLLEPGPEEKGRCLVSHRATLRLVPPPGCWVDVWTFERELEESLRASPASPEWFGARERAVTLYAGDLLPDIDEGWCAARRDGLRRRFLACLHELTEAEQAQGRYERACAWARRALAADECDEESHRSLMRLYALQGEHARAIDQYRACRRVLREERDASPDPETIALYQSLRPRHPVPKPRAGGKNAFPGLDVTGLLVGRERELDRLQTAWERARAGHGELILLTGEAGVGKSRLGRELLQEVALDGGLALHGQASTRESSFLYRPLIDPLRRALELSARYELTLCAPIWQAQVARLLPEMLPGKERPALPEGDGPRLIEQGIVQLFMALCAQRPLCLFIDDLQWADAATGRVLHALCHQIRQADLLSSPARILLIASVREEEVTEEQWLGPWLTELRGQRLAAALPVAKLNQQEVAQLLERLAGGRAPETLLRALGERLYEETEGNPLFLLETLRDLFERGDLVVDPDGWWRLAVEQLSDRLPLPASVQRVVRQRVDRLGEEERELLQCAAVIGRPFSFETLRRALGRDVEPALALLERLMAASLIRVQSNPTALNFSHDQIRDVIYEDLAPRLREALHQRVGEALESIYGLAREKDRPEPPDPSWYRRPPPLPDRAEHAEELARHFHAAAARVGPEKAARYYCLAGTRARALMDYEKAAGDLRAALCLLEQAPPDTGRLALWGQIAQQLAPAYRGTGRVETAREVLQEYLALCERQGYAAGIAHGCVLLGQFLELNPRAAAGETWRSMYERAIAVCEAHGLRDWIIYPQSYLAYKLAYFGEELERAEALARACLPRAEERQDQTALQRIHSSLMWVAARRGDWEAVVELFQASLASGGPYGFRIPDLLDEIERTCRGTGAGATFIGLCEAIAEGYARAGLAPPLEQWYLAPAIAHATRGEPMIREEFDEPRWHPALSWHGAAGRSGIDPTTRPGWLGLHPPVDCDLWPEADLNAPRLLATVEGDFVAETRLELGGDKPALAGLLLWRDEQQFVRLELRGRAGEPATVHLEACVAGSFRQIGRGLCPQQPAWLRLERTGDEARGLCSADGQRWLTCGAARLPQGKTEQVGLAAIAVDAGACAWFDNFLLWSPKNGKG
jgi:DNA-binding SARP family transcriptional activator/regulation of enolase protein 1 (concanavalin A-like superfamily)